jgi:fumarylacetoacetase
MSTRTDETHDPQLHSWLASANAPETDFPIQNLPFGRFRRDPAAPLRIGTAIGDQVLDLEQAGLIATQDMAQLMQAPPGERAALRWVISRTLRAGSSAQTRLRQALLPQSAVHMALPCEIGDYTDFYAGIHHARAVGALLRPETPLLPNYKWLPIGYHGRASSIDASPSRVRRPWGQRRGPDADAPPGFKPSARVDYELELGWFVARGNARGEPIPMAEAESHLFGVVLFNDWSARDIQGWEAQPLGPFLGKSFASTVSPWIVTLEALAPFRLPALRPQGDPQPLPYLDSPANRAAGAFDVQLEVVLQTAAMRAAGHPGDRLSASNASDSYWTAAQLLAHHASNGCNLRAGDLLGTGTLSGPRPEQGGSLLELSQGGQRRLKLSNGEERSFLEDGDCVLLRGHCVRPGFRRIGLGTCVGTIEAAVPPTAAG